MHAFPVHGWLSPNFRPEKNSTENTVAGILALAFAYTKRLSIDVKSLHVGPATNTGPNVR